MKREISRSTDFSTSDVSCLFTTFFAVLRWIDEKKKEKKEVKLRVHRLGKILKYEGLRLGRIRTEVEK